MSNVKVSIIIPVYNTEKYLKQCLDSVINQTFKDIEIICVNDGSTDGSLSILEEYANKDSRIKIINQKNAGAGAARNKGIENVKGEYVAFIDADDWLDFRTYECSYNFAKSKDLDMVLFKMINYDGNKYYKTDYYDLKCIDMFYNGNIFNHNDISNKLFKVAVSPVNKIFRRSISEKFNITFPEGTIFEDNPFFYDLLINSEKIAILDKYFYFRRRHKNSVTSNKNETFYDIIKTTNQVFDVFKKNNQYENYKMRLFNDKIVKIKTFYNRTPNVYKQDFFDLIKKDFTKIKEDINFSKEFESFLTRNSLALFENVFNASYFWEFDLLMLEHKMALVSESRERLLKRNNVLIEKNKELNNLKSSTSWNITKPLRAISRAISRHKK